MLLLGDEQIEQDWRDTHPKDPGPGGTTNKVYTDAPDAHLATKSSALGVAWAYIAHVFRGRRYGHNPLARLFRTPRTEGDGFSNEQDSQNHRINADEGLTP